MKDTKYQIDDSAHLKAAITNLGLYTEGELSYKWISLPISKEDLNKVLNEIGIDGKRYEEHFISDYECDISNVTKCLGEYENIRDLNVLSERLEEMSDWEFKQYEAALEGFGASDIEDLINITHNLDCYDFLPDVNNEHDLGYYWIEESGCYDTEAMGNLSNYIDYEKFGRDVALTENGEFVSGGYIFNNGNSFESVYDKDYASRASTPSKPHKTIGETR